MMVATARRHAPFLFGAAMENQRPAKRASTIAYRDTAEETCQRVAALLEKAEIDYAILGDLALRAHGCLRLAACVEVLLKIRDLERFRNDVAPEQFAQISSRPRRFIEVATGMPVHFFLTSHHPGYEYRGPITYPDPKTSRVLVGGHYYLDVSSLIQLKLAAQRHQDLADVVSLCRVLNLDEAYQESLHPSVRQAFRACLDEIRRDDNFHAEAC